MDQEEEKIVPRLCYCYICEADVNVYPHVLACPQCAQQFIEIKTMDAEEEAVDTTDAQQPTDNFGRSENAAGGELPAGFNRGNDIGRVQPAMLNDDASTSNGPQQPRHRSTIMVTGVVTLQYLPPEDNRVVPVNNRNDGGGDAPPSNTERAAVPASNEDRPVEGPATVEERATCSSAAPAANNTSIIADAAPPPAEAVAAEHNIELDNAAEMPEEDVAASPRSFFR